MEQTLRHKSHQPVIFSFAHKTDLLSWAQLTFNFCNLQLFSKMGGQIITVRKTNWFSLRNLSQSPHVQIRDMDTYILKRIVKFDEELTIIPLTFGDFSCYTLQQNDLKPNLFRIFSTSHTFPLVKNTKDFALRNNASINKT